jgi:hypothetical protein
VSKRWDKERGLRDRDRDRQDREREAEEKHGAETDRRGEELREAWRQHHPERDRPSKGKPA